MKWKTFLRKGIVGIIAFTFFISNFPIENFSVKAESNQNAHEQHASNEVKKLRTDTSKTFLNEDGTYTSEISQIPIHYMDEQGDWENIDNNLTQSKDKNYVENKANSFSVKVAKDSSEENTLVIEEENKVIGYGLETIVMDNDQTITAGKAKGTVSENTIVYPEILDGVALKYVVGSDRVKEDIIYKEKPTEGFANKFIYKLDLQGLEVKEEENVLYLIDPNTKEELYYVEAPYMYDSYIPKGFSANKEVLAIPEQAVSYDLKLELEEENGEFFIHLTPNQEWLNSEERVYPITIDPTIVRINDKKNIHDTNIRSGAPTQTGGSDTELGTGLFRNSTQTNVIRSLLKFDLSSIPNHVTVINADLNLRMSSVYQDTPITVTAHQVTSVWNESQATWNVRRTSPLNNWTTRGGDFSSTVLDSVSGLGSLLDLSTNLKWTIPGTLVNYWIANPSLNYGILLKSTSEGTNTYKKFISSEHSVGSEYHPSLVVTYKTGARLGLEDYWQYDIHPLVGGTSYTNLTTSNNVLQYDDFHILGRADSGITFKRTYNSKDLEKSALGYGWTFTGNEKLFINGKEIQYFDEDGTTHVFTYDELSKTYLPSAGSYQTIKKTADKEYTLINPSGTNTTFKIHKVAHDTRVDIAYIQTKTDRNGNKINYSYDSKNQLVRIATDLGNSLSKYMNIQYNTKNLISKVTYDDKEFSFRYTNDEYLEYVDQLRTKSGEKTTTKFVYKDKRIATIVDPNGRKTDFTYENGNIVKLQEPLEINGVKDPDNRPGKQYKLNIPAKMATVTDSEGNTSLYHVNDNFVIEKVVHPDGSVSEYELDKNYNVLTEKEIVDGKTTILVVNTYDRNGNVLTSKDAVGNVQTFTYGAYGNVTSHIDSNQKISRYEYDINGNLIKSFEPIDNTTHLTSSFEYNSFGDLVSLETSDGIKEHASIDYSSMIRIINNEDPYGNKSETKTDFSGNLLSFKDGMGNNTYYTYNLKNELKDVTNSKNNKTSYEYDRNGNLVSIINGAGAKSIKEYNGQNLLQSETNAIGHRTEYKYDSNGTVTEVIKPNGSTIEYIIDEKTNNSTILANGKVKWRYEREGEDQVIYNEYNDRKTISFYDNGLLKSTSPDSRGITTSYTYKGEEAIASISYPAFRGWNLLEYETNDAYQTTTMSLNNKNIVSFDYDKAGIPIKVRFNNQNNITRVYEHGRLESETLFLDDSKVFSSFKYRYDKNNIITSIESGDGKVQYEYDELNQLTGEIYPDGNEITYLYDEVGNRISKQTIKQDKVSKINTKYNEANQISQVGNQLYNYDDNGNLISDGKFHYIYNEFDQIIEIKNEIGETVATYGYDELGRRNYSNDNNGKTFYYYDADSGRVLYEEDVRLDAVKSYTYDDNNYPLTMTYIDKTYYYLTNYRGDVLALTDENGSVVASYTYDAWGNILSQNGEMADINPYRYAGYRYDDETGLYYILARYYNPSNGVFLSQDPVKGFVSSPITLNPYAYVENNPIMLYDPDGEITRNVKTVVSVGTGVLVVRAVVKTNINSAGKKITSYIGNLGKSKVLWGSWSDYKKVRSNGQTYAKVGNRLYSKHAVDRMQPSGNRYGSQITQAGGDYGRSVSPSFVENVIRSTKPVVQKNGNLSYTSGTLQVITNKQGAVVTIITR